MWHDGMFVLQVDLELRIKRLVHVFAASNSRVQHLLEVRLVHRTRNVQRDYLVFVGQEGQGELAAKVRLELRNVDDWRSLELGYIN